MNRGIPLKEEIRSWFLQYLKDTKVKSPNFSMTDLAGKVDLPRSTMRQSLLTNHPVSRRNMDKIMAFYFREAAQVPPEQTAPSGMTSQLPQTGISGNEKSALSEGELAALINRFSMGTDLLLPALRKLVNADPGTRIALRMAVGKQTLGDLFTFVRAIQSESVLSTVQNELKGKS